MLLLLLLLCPVTSFLGS